MKENNKNKKIKDTYRAYKQLKNISAATLLEESSHLRLIFRGITAVALLIFLLIIWSGFVNIKETTKSFGQLVPEGEIQIVQHLEGGIINKVYVDDGDKVKRGQILVQFDNIQIQAELDQLRGHEVSLILDSQRLNAFLNLESAAPGKWSAEVVLSKYNPVKYRNEIDKLLDDQQRLLVSQYEKINDQVSALKNTIVQREEKLKELKEQEKIWEKHMELLNKEFEMYQKLKENNYVSYKDYLTVLRAVNQAKGDGARINSEIEQTIQAIDESRNQLRQVISKEREEALQALSKVNGDLLEVRHKIEKLDDRIRQSVVRASIAGVIKGINVSAGNVLKPGGELMQIVPEGQKMVAEARVLPKEVGNLRCGEAVRVKVLTYDYARYGAIHGVLEAISASTFTDEENQPYYKAKIRLDQQYIGSTEGRKMLKAGMTVQADIITGEKTLLQYLLKPVHRSISSSFWER